LFEKPALNGTSLAFFVKPSPLVKTIIPSIRQLGDAYGLSLPGNNVLGRKSIPGD
jgi:hypothetical protein